MTPSERVQKAVDNRLKLLNIQDDFAVKYGFRYKRAQNFKNCIVIRWRTTKKKYAIDYDRIEEYVNICHDISDKYDLWDKEDPFLDHELRLIKSNILCINEWGYHTWAIPNEYKEIQDYVLSLLPKWAKLTRKK